MCRVREGILELNTELYLPKGIEKALDQGSFFLLYCIYGSAVDLMTNADSDSLGLGWNPGDADIDAADPRTNLEQEKPKKHLPIIHGRGL